MSFKALDIARKILSRVDVEHGDTISNLKLLLTLQLPDAAPSVAGIQSFDADYMQRLISLSAPSWKGVTDADAWIHELRGE